LEVSLLCNLMKIMNMTDISKPEWFNLQQELHTQRTGVLRDFTFSDFQLQTFQSFLSQSRLWQAAWFMYHDVITSRQLIVTHTPKHMSSCHLNNNDASSFGSTLNFPMLLQFDVANQRRII
jgi:hypothetical protein